MYIYDFFP
jgi:hypothetical protein